MTTLCVVCRQGAVGVVLNDNEDYAHFLRDDQYMNYESSILTPRCKVEHAATVELGNLWYDSSIARIVCGSSGTPEHVKRLHRGGIMLRRMYSNASRFAIRTSILLAFLCVD